MMKVATETGQLRADQFHLNYTLGSGQVFRWGRDVDGWWKGIAYNTVFHLKQEGDCLFYRSFAEKVQTYAGEMGLIDFLRWYLRLDEIPHIRVPKGDRHLHKARSLLKGLRFVRQEPFECIISYILSVQAHMSLTKQRINFIARNKGCPIDFEGERYFAFPDPMALADLDGAFYRKNRFGWRSERVADSAQFVAEGLDHAIGLSSVSLETWQEIADALYQRAGSGVGLKVARCIDLFSLERLHAVPVDTWVRKFAKDWYGITGSDAKICAWGEKQWGKWAGYCNEYLFSYYRELHGGSLYDRVISFDASQEPSAVLPFEKITAG